MSPSSLASILQWRLQHEVVGASWVVNPPKLREISAYFRESAVARWLQLLHQGCWGFVIVDWSSRILFRSFLKYRPSYIIIHSSRCISGGSLSRMSNSSWQIESYMILIDVRCWLTFRRLELSQSYLKSFRNLEGLGITWIWCKQPFGSFNWIFRLLKHFELLSTLKYCFKTID